MRKEGTGMDSDEANQKRKSRRIAEIDNVVAKTSSAASFDPQASTLGTKNSAASINNPSTNSRTSNGENQKELNKAQQQNLIRIVTHMFDQQAKLAHQQANILKQISKKMHENPDWKMELDDLKSRNSSCSTKEGTCTFKESYEKNTILDQAEVKNNLEREAVVNLATKSFQGMKQLQSTMTAFLAAQNSYDPSKNHNTVYSEHAKSRGNDGSDRDFVDENSDGQNTSPVEDIDSSFNNLKREHAGESFDEDPSNHEHEESIFSSLDIEHSTLAKPSQTSKRVKRERDESSSDDSTRIDVEDPDHSERDTDDQSHAINLSEFENIPPAKVPDIRSKVKRERDESSSSNGSTHSEFEDSDDSKG